MTAHLNTTTPKIYYFSQGVFDEIPYLDDGILFSYGTKLFMIETKRELNPDHCKDVLNYSSACKVIPVNSADDLLGSTQPYVYLFSAKR
ncbi:MAG: hypothetical protein OEW60_09095 [Thiovulaceae bacterium]|nr:hypothetical protein [Sulfurimonadaceae bacterium]